MKNIYLFDSVRYANLNPLVYCRPIALLRHGILTLLEKWQLSHNVVGLFTRDYLAPYYREVFPNLHINRIGDEGCVFVNPLYPVSALPDAFPEYTMLLSDDDIVAFSTPALTDTQLEALTNANLTPELLQNFKTIQTTVKPLTYAWDFIYSVKEEITSDFALLTKNITANLNGILYNGVTLINENNIYIGFGCKVKPGVVIDAEDGPVYIDENAEIMPNAVIIGPVYIGKNTKIKAGAKIYPGTSIGEFCKIGGEVEDSIIHSYANKQHEGFLGHSYLAPWVNLGADTNNSDLKNNYSSVAMVLNGKQVNTGKMFMGLVMGDHSKTGINTMINTGTTAGVFCNIFGAGYPPKFIPSYSWGVGKDMTGYDFEKAVETASVVMKRRNIELTENLKEIYRKVKEKTSAEWR